MLRDVLVVAINKGQLPILLGGTIILVLVLKMPGDDASKLLFGILEALERHEIIGYVLSAGITLAWLVQAAFARKEHKKETHRVGSEKSDLQKQLLGNRIRSSEDET
jgi:hypothetical protein